MEKLILKDGCELIIRKANKKDCMKIIDCLFIIGRESDYLEFGDNQWNITTENLEQFIQLINNKPNSIMAIALLNEEMVGLVSLSEGESSKSIHTGEFSIGVRKAYCGLGIGNFLIKFLIEWAKDTGIIKEIMLKVTSNNEDAIKLYKKYGFKEAGFQREIYPNGEPYDSVEMKLLIG